MNKFEADPGNREELTFDQYHEQIKEICATLTELNIPLAHYVEGEGMVNVLQEQWQRKNPLPVDKSNAIRVSITPKERLKVWFTNRYDDPKNPQRIEITKKLREKGFDVV